MMVFQRLLLLTLVSLTYASYPFENVFKKDSIVVSKTPKVLLNCMAKCIDNRVARELEKCEKKFPIGIISEIHGGKTRRVGDHMVTMTKTELIKIVNCVAQYGDRAVQKEFDECNNKQPLQTLRAFTACSEKIVGKTGLAFYNALAEDPELIPEIFECIRENTVEYKPKEAEQQISFETCARSVYSETCGEKLSDFIFNDKEE